jgi:hypothetical protein
VLSNRHRYDGSIRAGVFLIAVFAMAAARPARAQSSVGTISSVSGHVQIHRGGATLAATPGTPVNRGDQIGSGADGNAVIILNDQSKLVLRPLTTITLDQFTSGGATPTRVGLVSGVLRSTVNGTGGAPADYQVETPNAIVTVTGTDFYTAYTDSSPQLGNLPGVSHYTEVDVIKGSCMMSQKKDRDKCMDVASGSSATVPGDREPVCHKRKFDHDHDHDRDHDRDHDHDRRCERRCDPD